MTMKMREQLLNRNTRGGTEKEKADGRRAKKPTRGGRGADRSAWHKLQGENQSLPRNAMEREGPKPDLERKARMR